MVSMNNKLAKILCLLFSAVLMVFAVFPVSAKSISEKTVICKINKSQKRASFDAKVGQKIVIQINGFKKKQGSIRIKMPKKSKEILKKRYIYNEKMRRCYCIRVSFTARKPGTAKFVIKVRKRKYTISANIEDGSSQIDSKKRRCPEKSENDNTALYISDEERREEEEKQLEMIEEEATQTDGIVVIPYGIKYVANGFCSRNDKIKSVTIPETVIEIGEFAFSNCKKLECVDIQGNGLRYIRYAAFNGCQPGLKKFPRLPNSVEVIEDHALTHMSNAAFEDGKLKIPSSLRLLGIETIYHNDGTISKNDGSCATHIFYNVGGNSSSPLVAFEGSSDNYTTIDGVLYKKNKKNRIPDMLIAVPSGKTVFDAMDGSGLVQKGIYTMPNSVRSAAELSLGCSSKGMTEVVFSDAFEFDRRLDDNQMHYYNTSMYYNGVAYANKATIIGGYSNTNLQKYTVRTTNKKFKSYNGCIFSKNGKKLWAVPPAGTEVVLCDNTSEIDSGAFQQSVFGTPYNPNTGAPYESWIENGDVAPEYSAERKISSFKYNPRQFRWLDNSFTPDNVAQKIIRHTIRTVLKNGNSQFTVTELEKSDNSQNKTSAGMDVSLVEF